MPDVGRCSGSAQKACGTLGLQSAAPRGRTTEHLAVRSDGFETTELEFVRSITAPLFWAFRDSTGNDDQVKSGSVFFLDTGEGTYAVTAAHVVEECLRDSEYPVFQCMIGGNGPGRTVYLQRKNEKGSSSIVYTTASSAFTRG